LLLLLGSEPSTAEPARPLRLLTYNMLHGGITSDLLGDGQRLDERLAMTVEALRRLDADVIGLQEASRGRWRGDVAGRLADALGLEHVYAPAAFPLAVIRTVLGLDEGPAVLSRFPITASEAMPIEGCGLYRRAVVCATLRTPWGPLEACSTHVDGGFCQAERLHALVERRRGAVPVVLMGDLNATEDTPGIRLLTRAGFIDTFRHANPQAPGFTVWQWIHAPWRMAWRRVDYVLVAQASERPARVLESRVVLDEPGRAADGSVLWPSDHYGVLSVVDVFGSEPAGRSAAADHSIRGRSDCLIW
jgi:endonuclease/exonuclease/phosphatase family metal-dependent hydrolase